MQLDVSFRHFAPDESLKTFVQDKSETLKKYFQGNIHLTWILTQEKLGANAHCHLLGNNMDYFGEASNHSFMTAIEEALHRVETQVRKKKEMVRDHHPKQHLTPTHANGLSTPDE